MTRFIRAVAMLAAVGFGAPCANAAVLFQSNPDTSTGFGAFSSGGSTAVGLLTVSSSQTIGAIGVLDNLPAASNLKFFIADATTGTFLYLSGPKAFGAETGGDLNLTYKVSDGFSFTFLAGTTYAVGSIADQDTYTYEDGTQANSAGAFSSPVANVNVANYATPVLDTTQFCCSVGFELLDAPLNVPEPLSLALLGTAVFGTVLLRRRG